MLKEKREEEEEEENDNNDESEVDEAEFYPQKSSLVRTLLDQQLDSEAGLSLSTPQRLHVHYVLFRLRPSIMYLCHKQPKGKKPRQQLLPQTISAARVGGRDGYMAAYPWAQPACSSKLQRQRRVFFTSQFTDKLPWWFSGKESTCQCRRPGFNPQVGKTPWRRKWQATPEFLPGKSHGQRSLADYSPWGLKRGVLRVKHDLPAKQQLDYTQILENF